jgi:DNA-binding GntR family transcriptional regulator
VVVSGQSKAERVYHQLRADILAGRIPPGQRLRYTELVERYSTSMGVLREGMLRLAEQGLVRGEPQQGFQVTPLSEDDLRELTETRRELETLTLRLAIEDGTVDWESRLIAAHHRLSRTPQLDPEDHDRLSDAWVTAKNITAALRDSAELYRRWSVPLGDDPDRDIAAEHASILDATLAHDPEQATAHLASHVDRTTRILLATSKSGVIAS